MQELFAAIRQACSAATWSGGVELNRAGAVVGERLLEDGVEIRVSTQGGMVSSLVTLFVEDADWSCECRSREEACVHTAAAVIGLRRARQEGKQLPDGPGDVGRVAYRLLREEGGLSFERDVVNSVDAPYRLTSTLTALTGGRVRGPKLVAAKVDIDVERALGTHLRGVLPPVIFRRVMGLLRGHPEVTLDGQPIAIAEAEPVLRARVEDHQGDAFLLCARQDARIDEVFSNGAVRAGKTLRAIEEMGLSRNERDDLKRGRVFRGPEVDQLVGEVIPALRKRIPVDIVSEKLPSLRRGIVPRIMLDVTADGQTLSILPTLVYGQPPLARVDGDRLVHLQGDLPARDVAEEARLGARLHERLHLTLGCRDSFEGPQGAEMAQRLRHWRGEVTGTGLDRFFVARPLQPDLRVADDDFSLTFSADLDVPEAPAGRGAPGKQGRANVAAVFAAWERGDTLAPLDDGGWAPIPVDWLSRFGRQIADLLAARAQADEGLPRAVLPDLARLCQALEQPPPPSLEALATALETFTGFGSPALPDDLRAHLRLYQHEGVGWLSFMRDAGMGAILADDMGLGKTLQTLAVLRGRTLVVAPTSVLHNWAEEAMRFRPGLRLCIYHGAQRILSQDVDVVLTTYALLRLDLGLLGSITWDTLVLDEAQNIKNPDSQVARAAYALRAKFRIALSGTPVENRLEELWSQCHFTNPGLLGGRSDFGERYAKPIAAGEAGSAARLRARIKPFVLRRLKAEVAEQLPPRTDVVLRCELSDAERRVYEAVRAATREEVLQKLQGGGSVIAALEALLRLRQAACHTALVPGQQATTSSKVALLCETLDKTASEGHKALVFSQWTSLLDLVQPHLDAAGLSYLRLDGSTRDRAQVVSAFQRAGGPSILLISLKAGGTGLNLTAADNVFLLDPWWNPAVEDQAADRAHRIGQQRPVLVQRLVAVDTVEERILALQERKRDIAAAALGDGGAAAGLTREELVGLLL